MEPSVEPRDPTDGRGTAGQPLLQQQAASKPFALRACLLSGGESRRMGRDKALLPHPEGGSWLERTVLLLGQLEAPITLLSRHPEHLELAQSLNARLAFTITTQAEPSPWEGPMLALHRLMQQHPNQRLLLCPVDMPHLTLAALHTLLAATAAKPGAIHLAHDGQRLQPLLALYPSSTRIRMHLAEAVGRGERRLQGWLTALPYRTVLLDPHAIRNVNRPATNQLAETPNSSTLRSQGSSSASTSASSSRRGAGKEKGPSS